jgi:hypothetical protein
VVKSNAVNQEDEREQKAAETTISQEVDSQWFGHILKISWNTIQLPWTLLPSILIEQVTYGPTNFPLAKAADRCKCANYRHSRDKLRDYMEKKRATYHRSCWQHFYPSLNIIKTWFEDLWNNSVDETSFCMKI